MVKALEGRFGVTDSWPVRERVGCLEAAVEGEVAELPQHRGERDDRAT